MRRVAVLVLVPIAAVFGSCLAPTQIRVTITSNACTALAAVDVYVGAQPLAGDARATTLGCTDKSSPTGSVGSLVILPSGSPADRVDIAVVGSLASGACASSNPTGQDCIVARRTISFVPHAPLELPIFLDSACAGRCTNAGETCVVENGVPTCKSSTCDDDGGVVCTPDGGPVDSGPPIDVSTEDALYQCTNGSPGGSAIVSWSAFSTTDKNVHEDADKFIEPLNNDFLTGYLPECGLSLHVKDAEQILAQQVQGVLDVDTFTVAFTFRLSQPDGPLMTLISDPSNLTQSGFAVKVTGGVVDVTFLGVVAAQALKDTSTLDTTSPHTFVMTIKAGSSYFAWVDGNALVASTSPVQYVPAGYRLSVGTMEWIDNIAFYP